MKLKWNSSLVIFSISILIIFNFKLISSSEGDDDPIFIKCVENCFINDNSDASVKCKLDLVLRLSGWNCEADCKYKCMRWQVDKLRNEVKLLNGKGINKEAQIVQYYGKWPFIRVFGAQEIFSVIFSLGNFMACLYGYFYIYRPIRKQIKNRNKNVKTLWMDRIHSISLWITCNSWLQSAIFHYRDTPFTEKLDYFSASLFILSSLPVALIRNFRAESLKDQLKFVVPVAVLYFQHIAYMGLVDFNYGYNVKLNAMFGFVSNLLWLHWGIQQIKSGNNQRLILGRQLIQFVAINVLSMSLVAIDFPPFFDLIDVHALWHLSTIPITLMWYKFIASDLKNEFKN